MRALLDTMAFIWMAREPDRLSSRARTILADPSNELFLSPVSVVEIAIKANAQRMDVPSDLALFLRTVRSTYSIKSLDVTEIHAVGVRGLPLHHGDPFDRLLIAQAVTERLAIVTSDRAFARYPVEVLW